MFKIHTIAITLTTILTFLTPAWAAEQTSNRPTIALALGGGGVRGAAHIGVLRVFEREGLPIDFIAGSSMGAIVGGMYAAGVPLDKLEKMFIDRSIFRAYTPVPDTFKMMTVPASMFVRSAKRAIGLETKMIGLYATNNLSRLINKHVPPSKHNIEDADIPFVAVATNLLDGKAYSLGRGDLGKALQASSAIPFYVKPVIIDGKVLVDGALRANVPTIQARESGADIVISVNVDESLKNIEALELRKATSFGNRVASIILAELDGHHSNIADIEIHPQITPMPVYSRKVGDAQRAIAAGENAAQEMVPQIRMLLNSKLADANLESLTVAKHSH